jgi:hypothetical protein
MASFSFSLILRRSLLSSSLSNLRRCRDHIHHLGRTQFSLSTLSSDYQDDRKIALVLGSSGAVGNCVARHLNRELDMIVLGADVVELPSDFNESDWELDGFIQMPTYGQHPTVSEVTTKLASGVNRILGETDGIDTIVVASVRGCPLQYELSVLSTNGVCHH